VHEGTDLLEIQQMQILLSSGIIVFHCDLRVIIAITEYNPSSVEMVTMSDSPFSILSSSSNIFLSNPIGN
jgi:hypothetical protein